MSKVVSKQDFGPHGFRWLTVKRITYEDPHGRTRFWESAERLSRHGEVDGVAIITLVRSATEPLKVILESQFRPSQGNYVIELPAGLIDKGETAAEAAIRELKEETGYVGTVTEVSPICYSDPGMTNANMQFAVVEVDADAPENANINPELEEGEFIDVFLLPYDGLYAALLARQRETGHDMDARLLMYADAIERTQRRAFSRGGPDAAAAQADPGAHALPRLRLSSDRRARQTLTPVVRTERRPASACAGSGEPLPVLLVQLTLRKPEKMQNGSAPPPPEAKGHSHADGGGEEHINKEGFIPEDASPAVLKTELPPVLEHVAEQAPAAQEAFSGEILLENEALPGHEGPSQDGTRADDGAAVVRGEADRERSPSVDLAAGLRCGGRPEEVTLDADLEASLAHYLPMAPGGADARSDLFSTPLERSGSLIAMEPVPSPAKPVQQLRRVREGGAAVGNDHLVYCPVDVAPSSAPNSEGSEAGAERTAAGIGSSRVVEAFQPAAMGELQHEVPTGAGSSSDGFFGFSIGLFVGALAGSLLMYMRFAQMSA